MKIDAIIDFKPRNIPINFIDYSQPMAEQILLNHTPFPVDKFPDECPFCHHGITPHLEQGGHSIGVGREARVIMSCPKNNCKEVFIAYYRRAIMGGGQNIFCLDRVSIGNTKSIFFNDCIGLISPNFIIIYNQSFASEQYQLLQIAGGGYRKSLEFLIKDYVSQGKSEQEQNNIKTKPLGQIIENNISNQNLKDMAKRAAWLGNDETHYERIWEGRDLTDLKKMINATVAWIELENYTKETVEAMPKPQ